MFILSLLLGRCEVGTESWMQCNDSPVKNCKYAVQGLLEGHSYYFRVRAVNSHGIGRPSRMSEPIAALDPTEFERIRGEQNEVLTKLHLVINSVRVNNALNVLLFVSTAKKLGGRLDVVTYYDDLEGNR